MKKVLKSLALAALMVMVAAPMYAQKKQVGATSTSVKPTVSTADTEEAAMVKSPTTYAENETKGMQNDLGLTNEQAQALKEIHKRYAEKIKAVKENASLSKEAKKAQIKTLRDEKREEIHLLLTPEQYAKWEQKKGEHHGEGHGDGHGKGHGEGHGKGHDGKGHDNDGDDDHSGSSNNGNQGQVKPQPKGQGKGKSGK